jgi:hypothetical protein
VRRELCVLLCHYLRQKDPVIYSKFARFTESHGFMPPGSRSMDDALNMRYHPFPADHFYTFIKSLRPTDDDPSIFRRISPFPVPSRDRTFESLLPVKRVFQTSRPVRRAFWWRPTETASASPTPPSPEANFARGFRD